MFSPKTIKKTVLKKSLKYGLNNLISNFIPVSSKFIGRPRKIDSILPYSLKKEALYFQYESLVCLETELNKRINNYRIGKKTLLFICQFNKARVWGRYGAVITSDDTFLKDVSLEFPSIPPIKHSIFYTLKQKKCKYIKGNSAVISAAGANIYYHWMIDILPRIALLKRQYNIDQFDNIICDYTAIPFQTETLEYVGISTERILKSNDNWNFHIENEMLVVPSMCGLLDCPNIFQVESLRNMFAEFISEEIPMRKIYISRINSSTRKLINEVEVIELLESEGFEIIRCEEMSIFEQIKKFSEAKIILGPHGSGFTNLVFCHNGTKVMEFFNDSYINPCFSIIANIRALNYSFIVSKSLPIDSNYKNNNIKISMEELQKALLAFNE